MQAELSRLPSTIVYVRYTRQVQIHGLSRLSDLTKLSSVKEHAASLNVKLRLVS